MNFVQKIVNDNVYKNSNVYDGLGMLQPFTILVGSQFNNFIGELSKSSLLEEEYKESFNIFWNCFCIDIDSVGNNIWNIPIGIHEVFSKNDISISYEKKDSRYDKYFSEGRANIFYKSKNGNFVINQNEKNKEVFSVYVSNEISNEFIQALSEAESKALNIPNISNKELESKEEESGKRKR